MIPLQRYAKLLGHYLRPQWRRVALMAALLLTSIGLQLVVPQILRFFIDTARTGGSLDALVRAAVWFLVIAVVTQLLSAAATYYAADVGWTATNAMREDLARHTLALDMSFHTARTPGELIERIDGDVTALSNFFSQFSVRVLGGVLHSIAFAPAGALGEGAFLTAEWSDVATAIQVSAYSLKSLAVACRPLLSRGSGILLLAVMAAIDSAASFEKPSCCKAGIHCSRGVSTASTGWLSACAKAAATSVEE